MPVIESISGFMLSKREIPVITQAEGAECGLACLAMIAAHYGYETDLHTMRSKFSAPKWGLNLQQITEIASRIGLAGRAITTNLEGLSKIHTPCILHWSMDHFVVLTKAKKNNYILHDPAIGKITVSKELFSRQFTGVALELFPTNEFKKKEDKFVLKLRDFIYQAVGVKKILFNAILLSLFLQFFILISPFYMQLVVDSALVNYDKDLLLALALGFFLLLIIEILSRAFRDILIQSASYLFDYQVATNLFNHLIRLPMSYYYSRSIGDIISRFGSLKDVRNILTTGAIHAIIDAALSLIAIVIMFFYSVKLTVIVVVTAIVYSAYRSVLFKKIRNLSGELLISQSKQETHFIESIRGIQTVRIYQKENDRQQQWRDRFAETIKKQIMLGSWNIANDTVGKAIFGAQSIAIVYIAALMVIEGGLTVGMIFAYIAYKNRFNSSVLNLINQWMKIKLIEVHLSRLSDIAFTEKDPMITKYEKQEKPNHDLVNSSANPILCVENLSFRYSESDPYIFKNLNFSVDAGESAGIIGPSGSGKTTLLKCLMGLIEPTEGCIKILGKDIRHMPSYKENISGVMQDDQLFSGFIAGNIACFEKNFDLEKVISCAKIASIHDDIMNMTMGYNTLVGDMGSALSGGQKQRIILARALYRSPQILFLDEATSHLDFDREKKINENLKILSITKIIVAHREETIRNMDKIISIKT